MSRDGARSLLKRHELYAELLDVVARELIDLGTPEETAELIAPSWWTICAPTGPGRPSPFQWTSITS